MKINDGVEKRRGGLRGKEEMERKDESIDVSVWRLLALAIDKAGPAEVSLVFFSLSWSYATGKRVLGTHVNFATNLFASS